MTSPRSSDIGGLAVSEWGAPDGAPLVLLHAGVCDRRSWTATASLVSGRHVVAYGRRGFGDTAPADVVDDVADLVSVLDAVGAEAAWRRVRQWLRTTTPRVPP